MRIPIWLTGLLALCSFERATSKDHAIYLSVVEIQHKPGENTSVKIKVFRDDMEDALMNEFQKRISLGNAGNCESNKTEIVSYFSKHFRCSINGTVVSLRLNNCELTGDAIWFHFETISPSNWKEVKITADYFLELFPTQSNVISIYHGDEKRFVRITHANPTEIVRF